MITPHVTSADEHPLSLPLDAPREVALVHAAQIVGRAWRSFDHFRPYQPGTSQETADLARGRLPNDPMDVHAALDLAERVLDESLAQPRPRYFAYVGASGLEVAVLGDLLATTYDLNMAVSAHAADLIEAQTARWLGELIGYPVAAGYCTSGGMISNLTALTAARERALPGARRDGLADRRAAVYCSAEAHSSVSRAVEILGLGSAALRAIPIDSRRRMDVAELRRRIKDDHAAGVVPMAVVATAGTTLTGAVDPLDQVAEVCEDSGAWMHVDGAYGLPGAATATAGGQFAGLGRADSVCIDAHKWLYVPKSCSWLLVRDPHALTAAFGHESSYMPRGDGVEEHLAVDHTLEYSRPFRALKLWLALRTHGAAAFRIALERNVQQALLLADLVRQHPDLELLAEPTLTVVPFRHVPGDADVDVDEHNRRLVHALQEDGRFWMSDAVVDGMTCLRPCLVNFRTTDDDVRELLEVVDELAAGLR